ncbi:MAG: FG-GAP-like repeat-containing protein, partial [Bacteroidales bacterium]|nr:FG-GAP-like repeat-containing protein [Bacteroidales bacterium]
MNINISAQIPFQSGWPIIFDDICTYNPVVCEDINPNYNGKELLFIAGGNYKPFPPPNPPVRLFCYSASGQLIFDKLFSGTNHWSILSYKPVVADIDNDGSKEIIVTYIKTATTYEHVTELNIYNYDGTQYNENAWPITYDEYPLRNHIPNVSVADLDNDGDLEICTVINQDKIIIYHHDGTVVTNWPYVSDKQWNNIWGVPLIADLDFDNDKEIVCLTNQFMPGAECRLHLLDHNANAIWTKTFNACAIWMSPVVAELNNNNSSLEMVFSDTGPSTTVRAYNLDGSCVPGFPVIIPHSNPIIKEPDVIGMVDEEGEIELISDGDWNGASPITVADIDKNGDMEIIVVGSNELHILNNDGSYFEPFPELILGDDISIHSPSVVDIDNDDNPDLIFMTYDRKQFPSPNGQLLYAYNNQGVLLEGFPIIIKEFNPDLNVLNKASRINPPSIDDIDNDGDVEIIVTGWSSYDDGYKAGGVYVYDLPGKFERSKVEWKTSLKNNWNNGIYAQGVSGIGNDSYYFWNDNIEIRNNFEVSPGTYLNILPETRIFGNNSQLEVYGDVIIGERSLFTSSLEENNLNLIIDNVPLLLDIEKVNFHNTHWDCMTHTLNIDDCEFFASGVYFKRGYLGVESSYFYDSYVHAYRAGSSNEIAQIKGCLFQNSDTNFSAITIEEYPRFLIFNNDIFYSAGDGISIFTSGVGLPYIIEDNEIQYSGSSTEQNYGIKVYRSLVEIENNYIHGNRYGVACMDYSEVSVIGNSNAGDPSETQRIINNTLNQVYSFPNSFPVNFRWNAIYNDIGNDPLVYHDIPYIPAIPFLDVRWNYWGENFIPENDLYPYQAYIYLPTWPLGGGGQKSILSDETLFQQAKQDIIDSNYVDAKTKFKQIIAEYPESFYLKPSVKELAALEEIYNFDFTSLKVYLDSMLNLHSNDDINKFTDYFENWCDIKNEDFEDAISWFENVIENPDTPEDSIFAIIDIAYTYNLMDTLNFRYVGKYPELKPVSRSQFTKDREILIDKLFHLKHSNYS